MFSSSLLLNSLTCLSIFSSVVSAKSRALRSTKETVQILPHVPIYNPTSWPRTLNLTSEPNTPTSCHEFPDANPLNEVPGSYVNTPLTFFCYQNDTLDDYGTRRDPMMVKTTSGCYVFEDYLIVGDEIVIEDLLPWCGPVRPYKIVDGSKLAAWNPLGSEEKSFPYSTECYRCPGTSCESVGVDPFNPTTYCWVKGEGVNGTDIWHESARNIQTWGKCYLPGWIFNDDAAISLNQTMKGAGEQCPDWDEVPRLS